MSGAQSKAILGQPFARHYVHAGMVGLDGEKMSKSKGNLVFVSRLLNEGVDPVSIRYALLRDHYQSDRMWSAEKLKTAQESVANIRIALSREEVASTDSVISNIVSALANNLDTPAALNALEEWALRTIGNQSQADQLATREAGNLSRILDSLLGLAF